jgi:exonuclease VII small subunit
MCESYKSTLDLCNILSGNLYHLWSIEGSRIAAGFNHRYHEKYIIILAALSLYGLTAVAQQAKGKLNAARKDMVIAKADLKQAQKDSIAEYRQFRSESLATISENNNKIEALRAKKAAKEKAAAEEFNQKVKSLEDQNVALRESVNNYRADGNTNWVVFKREWNKQMGALQQSFSESRYE